VKAPRGRGAEKYSQNMFEGGKGRRNKCEGILTHTRAREEQQSWKDLLSPIKVGEK